MARANKTDDGTALVTKNSYAQDNRERIMNGEAAVKQEEMHELDTAEAQERILNPEILEINLLAGGTVRIRKAIGPADVKKRRVMDCLRALTELLILETAKLSGDGQTSSEWFARNQTYMRMAARRFNVLMMAVEAINAFANTVHTIDDFDEAELSDALFALFAFYLEQQAKAAENSKNAPAA